MNKTKFIVGLVIMGFGLLIILFKNIVRKITGTKVTFYLNTPMAGGFRSLPKKKESNKGLNVVGGVFIALGLVVMFS